MNISLNQYHFIFLAAFGLALLLTPLAIRVAPKIGAVDVPKDDRRMHTRIMPRFGGAAIYVASTAAMLVFLPINTQLLGVIGGGTLMFVMGIVDDLRGLPAKVKLLGQILCAFILFQFSVRISFIANPFGDGYFFFPWALSLLVTVIWIVGITNTINLIDGLDGLAAGISILASITIAYAAFLNGRTEIALAMLALAGGALGFLPYNFHPARIFMGDAGSLYLGFMMAGISVMGPMKSATLLATLVPMFVLALPIFDTAFAILRRMINKRPIMEADKRHLHHRIMSIGLGQKRSVLTLYCISGVMGVAAILISRRGLGVETGILILVAATLIYVFVDDSSHLKAIHPDEPENQEEQDA